ncbi:MAG: cadherin repeat domain-containing protein, partial [bacterium]|nr:cadherin repeat domain-containing protein [bacterium]
SLIKSVKLAPAFSHEGSVLEVTVETARPITKKQYFSYQFWVNGEKMGESDSSKLASDNFDKNDTVFADVFMYHDGQLADRKRTQSIHVANTRPIIEEVILPEVEGTGTYKITVKAHDPDGDTLTFSLEKKDLPVNVTIDSATGTISCVLDQNTPENLNFNVVATDPSGAATKKSINLDFFKQPKAKTKEAEGE